MPDRRRTHDGGSRAHVDIDTAKVLSVAGGGIHQREKCDAFGEGVCREEKKLCRAKFLGARLLCDDGGAR